MSLKIYNSKEDALNDIDNLKKQYESCLDVMLDDVFTSPLYLFLYKFDNQQIRLGEIDFKFTYPIIKPMIHVGNWVLYIIFDVEILSVRPDNEEYLKFFDRFIGKTSKFDYSLKITQFANPFIREISFFQKFCNLDELFVDLGNLKWNS
jgi:hypothetical protein